MLIPTRVPNPSPSDKSDSDDTVNGIVPNGVAAGYTDFEMVKHAPLIPHLPVLSLPLSFFTLTGSSLGLLLVFRTNAAYGRWDDARKVWGSIINNCRSLGRQANTFFAEDRYPGYGNFRDYRRRVAAETSAFTRCLRCFLRGKADEPNLEVELKKLGFTPDESRIREVVNKVDTNHNGELEFPEFCEFLKLAKQGVGLSQAVEKELDSYSTNDGIITRDEIFKLTRTFAENLGQNITEEDIEVRAASVVPLA